MQKKVSEVPVLIHGGGTAGICTAIQLARMGIDVLVVEPTAWIGGMITAAGVSALDGNKYGAGGGIVHEFRQKLATHYGSIESLFTGWISLYCFEPHIGHKILQEMVAPLYHLHIQYNSEVIAYEIESRTSRKITILNNRGEKHIIYCSIFVEATEYGDGLKLANIPYRLGRESRDVYEEEVAPEKADMEMQDLTYVAILEKQHGVKPQLQVSDEDEAYWQGFKDSISEDCSGRTEQELNHKLHSWESFIGYACLPNHKYLLNWPFHSNDFPLCESFFEDKNYRNFAITSAKLHTHQFVKYIQHKLKHPEWQLALNEFPTVDGLPLIPYIRETRRMVNSTVMTLKDVVAESNMKRPKIKQDSIAVGDYFIDHHHAKSHLPKGQRLVENYPNNAPFQIAPTVFFPDGEDDRFLVTEKSISVSHIVNGCTRLQPVVMLMGQALGAIIAHALYDACSPREVNWKKVQKTLIEAGCQLFIWYDISPEHELFGPSQNLFVRGVYTEEEDFNFNANENLNLSTLKRWTRKLPYTILQSVPDDEKMLHPKHFSPHFFLHLPATEAVTRGEFIKALDSFLRLRTSP